MRLEIARALDDGAHLLFGVAVPVVTAQGVVADEVLETHLRVLEQRVRKVQQTFELLVARGQAQLRIEQRDASGEVFDDRRQRVVLPAQRVLDTLAFGDVAPDAVDHLPLAKLHR